MIDNSTKSTPNILKVDADDDGQRLDNYLVRKQKGVPKSLLYRLLRKGAIRVNKGRKKPDYRIKAGDLIKLPDLRRSESDKTAFPFKASELTEMTLFEDKNLLAVNKPTGLAVHGGSGIEYGLIEKLRASDQKFATAELVHRLDRSTSGCLLIALNRKTLRKLQEQLRDKLFIKRYLTLLRGHWPYGEKAVETRLDTSERKDGERTVVASELGKQALSHFRPVEFYARATLMEVEIDTGRTHQIRVHAADLGHPVAGDEKYGDKLFNQDLRKLGLKRMFLHAHYLEVPHYQGEESLLITAPLSPELKALLDQLERHAE